LANTRSSSTERKTRPSLARIATRVWVKASTRWICLLRCLESGVRIPLSAELFSSPQSPQFAETRKQAHGKVSAAERYPKARHEKPLGIQNTGDLCQPERRIFREG
jgi:hypothetical protein